MLNSHISKLNTYIIIIISTGCFFFIYLFLICGFNSSQPTETSSLYNEIQETLAKEFMFGINISRNSLNKDKDITLYRPLPLTSFNTSAKFDRHLQLTPAVLKEHIAEEDVAVVFLVDANDKIHNDFHYGINKNNQENNSNNQKPTPSLSTNIKLVKSSSSTSASSTLPLTSTTSAPSEYFERVELHEAALTHTKNEKLLLHRNKRYLLFPDGSSFQLVFDLIVPIVDYTNYAIMGITCAVAWELPSKPPSEIIENFRHKLNDGTFGLTRRNDSIQQLKYINSHQTEGNKDDDEEEGGTIPSNNEYNLQQQPQQHRLSATVATTSAHQNFITNALKQPPPSSSASNFYYNSIIQPEKFLHPKAAVATTSFYNQHRPQQQKWHNYNLETGDSNQRKTFYGSDNERPMHRKDFTQHSKYYKDPTYKGNSQNWHPKQLQQHQPKQTKPPYNDAGDYWNKDNWWERNKNRIERQWHENPQKWSQYQEKQSFSTSQQNYHIPPSPQPMFSKRTGRNRKILNKPPKHRIYPVFGKRRRRRSSSYGYHSNAVDNDDLTKKLQEIHAREHLNTRQKLYGKIEKLYRTRGHNGTACVLRALCETEKIHLNARYNEAPQSFVMELLRSIFALPKDTLTNSKDSMFHINADYSDAVLHAHEARSQSCSQQYNDCAHGISYDMQF